MSDQWGNGSRGPEGGPSGTGGEAPGGDGGWSAGFGSEAGDDAAHRALPRRGEEGSSWRAEFAGGSGSSEHGEGRTPRVTVRGAVRMLFFLIPAMIIIGTALFVFTQGGHGDGLLSFGLKSLLPVLLIGVLALCSPFLIPLVKRGLGVIVTSLRDRIDQ